MILSDRETRAALIRQAIRITPDPQLDPDLWTSTALDMRLHEELARWVFPAGTEVLFRPAAPEYNFNAMRKQYGQTVVIPAEGLVVRPGEFYLGWTIELLQLPHRSRIAARVEGKSSLARLGLGVHVTAPTIHAGFGYKSGDASYLGSSIQLEIWNFGPVNVVLQTGMKICQLIFEFVDGTPEMGYEGRFAVQGPQETSPSASPPPPTRPWKRKRRAE
jgi:dCTP deaminase